MKSLECYEKIINYHRTVGIETMKKDADRTSPSFRAYCDLLKELPSPSTASKGDCAVLFGEVMAGLLQPLYDAQDGYGIRMADYAKMGFKDAFGTANQNNIDIQNAKRTSRLYKKYSNLLWMEMYKK